MGRPPLDLNRENVFAAIDQLCGGAKLPNPERVAAALGCGNRDRIRKLLAEWWRALPERLEPNRELEKLRPLVTELLRELSFCRITHAEPSRGERVENLVSEIHVVLVSKAPGQKTIVFGTNVVRSPSPTQRKED
jgi:hypothetical protein